jgi:hypothetical protein
MIASRDEIARLRNSHIRGHSDSASARRVCLVRFCTQLAGIEVVVTSWLQRARITLSWDGAQPPRSLPSWTAIQARSTAGCTASMSTASTGWAGGLPRSGRSRRLGELDRGRVMALARSGPPGRLLRQPDGSLEAADAQASAHWTLDALALAHAAQAKGIQAGRSQVRRILQTDGCAGAPCSPGAPAATRSSPQASGGLRGSTARWGARPRPRLPPRRPRGRRGSRFQVLSAAGR